MKYFLKNTLLNSLKKLAVRCIVGVVRCLLSLRYRIEVRGLDSLDIKEDSSKGILFLPNHPAEIDPIILMVFLWERFRPRPVIVEHFYILKGFRVILDLIGVIPMPTIDHVATPWRTKKVRQCFETVQASLEKGENCLIYPAGRLKLSSEELIGGASFAHDLLQTHPDTPVVLIRTTGLWGSRFSRAVTGLPPDFVKTLKRGFKILLKNGIFFCPRRKVVIDIQRAPEQFAKMSTRLEFNRYLENWYNRYPAPKEPLYLVSYAFWKEKLPEIAKTAAPIQKEALLLVPPAVEQEVLQEIARLSERSPTEIQHEMKLSYDLGFDSLDIVQLYVFLGERYEVSNLAPGELQTVEDVLQAAVRVDKAYAEDRYEEQLKVHWGEIDQRKEPHIPEGNTISEVFLKSCERMGKEVACTDRVRGALSYEDLKRQAVILSLSFSKIRGAHVGIMLPSSSTTYVLILALMLARKIPVMLNWTAGVKVLEYVKELTGLRCVITSERFLDHLDHAEFGSLEKQFLLLEEIKGEISLKDKLLGSFYSLFPPSFIAKRRRLYRVSQDSPAVILFTSGTETVPKGVPLSHRNILSNLRAGFQIVPFAKEDIVYGVLPPFHSFGFSVTGLFPLLTGMRVCYAPDPTDTQGLLRDIKAWRPTLFCCAPSFFKALFRIAEREDLQSLHWIISGAERTPGELFDFVKESIPGAKLLEGYGITECSPVVTIDRVDEEHQGVGRPLSNVSIRIINPETGFEISPSEQGEICIAGDSVFSGYLSNAHNPFITLDGKKYYRSGDLGYFNPQGALILSGRRGRFVKIGGEMVSLGGLEEEITALAFAKGWVEKSVKDPFLAISVREKESDKAQIILFTTFSVDRDLINQSLKERGEARVAKISEVRCLSEIPLTGTGKTHYRFLDELCGRHDAKTSNKTL